MLVFLQVFFHKNKINFYRCLHNVFYQYSIINTIIIEIFNLYCICKPYTTLCMLMRLLNYRGCDVEANITGFITGCKECH